MSSKPPQGAAVLPQGFEQRAKTYGLLRQEISQPALELRQKGNAFYQTASSLTPEAYQAQLTPLVLEFEKLKTSYEKNPKRLRLCDLGQQIAKHDKLPRALETNPWPQNTVVYASCFQNTEASSTPNTLTSSVLSQLGQSSSFSQAYTMASQANELGNIFNPGQTPLASDSDQVFFEKNNPNAKKIIVFVGPDLKKDKDLPPNKRVAGVFETEIQKAYPQAEIQVVKAPTKETFEKVFEDLQTFSKQHQQNQPEVLLAFFSHSSSVKNQHLPENSPLHFLQGANTLQLDLLVAPNNSANKAELESNYQLEENQALLPLDENNLKTLCQEKLAHFKQVGFFFEGCESGAAVFKP